MTQQRKLGWRDLGNPRIALMIALSFSTGLPFLLVFSTASVRLREAGIPVSTIGLFSWLGLAYSLKFIWSPLVDAFDVPILARLLGRRRAWMVVSQVFIAAGLVGVGLSDPAASLAMTAAFTFVVALVALYRMSDFLAGTMSSPLYVDLGFTKAQIASVAKVYGVIVAIIGAFAGGLMVARYGLFRSMLAGAAAQALSHLAFAWLSTQGASITALMIAISMDNFSQSFGGTILVTYMSGLTGAGFAATQYALLSSMYALPGKLIAGASGFMVEAYGYTAFFCLTATILIPVAALTYFVRRDPRGGLGPAPETKDAEAPE